MTHPRYDLPGVTPRGGPEPTLEWVRPGAGVLGRLSARLGSDPRAEELLVAVLRALRRNCARDTWDGILDELPFSARALLRASVRPGEPDSRGERDSSTDLVARVAAEMQHPFDRTRLEVAAVFATLRDLLPRGLSDALAEELPADLADLWRTAR